jgi:checkpoint serine/threonine-protein kinase
VDVEAVYPEFPDESKEYCFEELRAIKRGWIPQRRHQPLLSPMRPISGNEKRPSKRTSGPSPDVENITQGLKDTSLVDTSTQSLVGMPEGKTAKVRRMKVREVKQETQTVKTNLESPTRKKLRRKGSAEPTMTLNSKSATNDIYDMFNQTRKINDREDTQSSEETDYGDDTYSSAGEMTGTGRMSAPGSDFGDETLARVAAGDALFDDHTQGSQPTSVSPWSEFTSSKHVPQINPAHKLKKHKQVHSDDLTCEFTSSQNPTQTSALDAFDTQAIAAIADLNLDDMKSRERELAEDVEQSSQSEIEEYEVEHSAYGPRFDRCAADNVETNVALDWGSDHQGEIITHTEKVPLQITTYDPTVDSYDDYHNQFNHGRRPPMTPIAEQTESVASTIFKKNTDYFSTKTTSKDDIGDGDKDDSPSKLPLQSMIVTTPQKDPSPKRKILETIDDDEDDAIEGSRRKLKTSHPMVLQDLQPVVEPSTPKRKARAPETWEFAKPAVNIADTTVFPCDNGAHEEILNHVPLRGFAGFWEEAGTKSGLVAKILSDHRAKTRPKTLAVEELRLPGTNRVYAVKRSLGEGGYGMALLVNSVDPESPATTSPSKSAKAASKAVTPVLDASGRADFEVVKVEMKDKTLKWEFYIINLIRARLAASANPDAVNSFVEAHECHVFADEAYLVLNYAHYGTLLSFVNLVKAGSAPYEGKGLQEPVAMFLGAEVLKTVEYLHSVGIMHGDLKADNVLGRFDPENDLQGPFNKEGWYGWADRGVIFIDFGRGIDTTCYKRETTFLADWSSAGEVMNDAAPEISANRPWKWGLDWYGAADTMYPLLFAQHMAWQYKAGAADAIGPKDIEPTKFELNKRTYARELWLDVFDSLLNKGNRLGDDERVAELARLRGMMEDWLEVEGNKKGVREKLRADERLLKTRA